MERTKLLRFLIAGLILLNIGALTYIFTAKSAKQQMHDELKKGEGPKQIIIDRLHLDAEQQQQYMQMVTVHRTKMMELNDSSRQLHDELFGLLKVSEQKKLPPDQIIEKISNIQKAIENLNFTHFNEIKELCRKDQLDDFYDLVDDLGMLFHKGPAPKPIKN